MCSSAIQSGQAPLGAGGERDRVAAATAPAAVWARRGDGAGPGTSRGTQQGSASSALTTPFKIQRSFIAAAAVPHRCSVTQASSGC